MTHDLEGSFCNCTLVYTTILYEHYRRFLRESGKKLSSLNPEKRDSTTFEMRVAVE